MCCLSDHSLVKRPFPSSKNLHFQNEVKCTTFLVKMSFICIRIKNHFHIKGWALHHFLIQKPRETWKWLIKKAVFTSLGGMLANQQSNGPYFQVQKTLTFKMLEAKCKTLLVTMSFICMRGKIHFHINTFAFSLALKQKLIIIYF